MPATSAATAASSATSARTQRRRVRRGAAVAVGDHHAPAIGGEARRHRRADTPRPARHQRHALLPCLALLANRPSGSRGCSIARGSPTPAVAWRQQEPEGRRPWPHRCCSRPMQIAGVTLKNRVVVAPMHQYAAVRGFATDWHLMNAGRYAAGGAGLMMVESTKVERRGCGTMGDLGLWDDALHPRPRPLVEFIRAQDRVAGIQIGHSGRKARRFRPWEGGAPLARDAGVEALMRAMGGWELVAPSAANSPASDPTAARPDAGRDPGHRRALGPGRPPRRRGGLRGAGDPWRAWLPDPPIPLALHQPPQRRVRRRRAQPHALLHRGGGGGPRAIWPAEKPLFLRLSVEDDVGWDPDQSVRLAKLVKPKGVDVIDCSSGGMPARRSTERRADQLWLPGALCERSCGGRRGSCPWRSG